VSESATTTRTSAKAFTLIFEYSRYGINFFLHYAGSW
jgi:hypothetical protein